jgi:glycosyltransferase involved in cell wall biosynthesis
MKKAAPEAVRPRISAIVITRDAEKHLRECLRSVAWCDEIVVLDSGSMDRTLAIAREFTENIHEVPWRGFGPQKQAAVDRATSEWVLSLDADERITDALRDEMIHAMATQPSIDGFAVPRKNFHGERWLRFGGQYPDYVLRLFRRSRGRFSADVVHERALVEGRTARLRHAIEHRAFEDLESRIAKLNRYSTLSARQLHEAGRRAGPFAPLVHFLAFFLKDYVLRLGFLDGRPGFEVALLKSLGAYYKYAKLIEYGAAPPGK